jgi:hypothetical protein
VASAPAENPSTETDSCAVSRDCGMATPI